MEERKGQHRYVGTWRIEYAIRYYKIKYNIVLYIYVLLHRWTCGCCWTARSVVFSFT